MYFFNVGGNMTNRKLDVLRGLDGFEHVLVKNLTPADAQESLFPGRNIPPGRCWSLNAAGQAELGVGGHRVPYFNFHATAAPSTGTVSDPTPIENATDVTWKSDADHKVLMYCGIDSLELATTEFIPGAYAVHDLLVSPDLAAAGGTTNDLINKAGYMTNVAARGGLPQWGADAIVGVVVESTMRKPHRVDMLVFYSLYCPVIEGLKTGTPVNLA